MSACGNKIRPHTCWASAPDLLVTMEVGFNIAFNNIFSHITRVPGSDRDLWVTTVILSWLWWTTSGILLMSHSVRLKYCYKGCKTARSLHIKGSSDTQQKPKKIDVYFIVIIPLNKNLVWSDDPLTYPDLKPYQISSYHGRCTWADPALVRTLV